MTTILAIFGLLVIGYRFGWAAAHLTVATECERLGKFFVGKRIYVCTEWYDAPKEVER